MIDMNDKLMVDRDCFERGCMSIPHTHVRAIKDDEVVWMVREKAEPTRWKPWVGLTDEDIFGIFGTYRGDANYNHDRLLLDARRIEAMLKELNT